MNKQLLLSTFLLFGLYGQGFTQTNENLEDINAVWAKFTKAFETLDHSLMAEIHSKDLVRVSGGRSLNDYQTYIDGYITRFERVRENGGKYDISLRFFERVNNGLTGSERGVYQLISNKGQTNERTDYGQFHVIFRKEDDEWKILVDYDSSEGGSIGEKNYADCHSIDDLDMFIKP